MELVLVGEDIYYRRRDGEKDKLNDYFMRERERERERERNMDECKTTGLGSYGNYGLANSCTGQRNTR